MHFASYMYGDDVDNDMALAVLSRACCPSLTAACLSTDCVCVCVCGYLNFEQMDNVNA